MDIFVDGACSGNPGPGGWAVFVNTVYRCSGRVEHTTNNRMELEAIHQAPLLIPARVKLTIWSDSEWAINVITGKYRATVHLDLISEIQSNIMARAPMVNLEWVRGHGASAKNDIADRMATSAIRGQTIKPWCGGGHERWQELYLPQDWLGCSMTQGHDGPCQDKAIVPTILR